MSILDGEATTIALCWRLERMDGAGVALTSHDAAVMSEGVRYEPAPGIAPASVTRRLGLEPHSAEVSGAFSSDALDEADLSLGRWDGAQVRLTAVDWRFADTDVVPMIAGELGSVSMEDARFSAELLGAAARLEAPVCPSTSAECRAQFGDERCRIDLAGRTMRARVIAIVDGAITLDAGVDSRFVLGRFRYMSGANCGLSSVILAAEGTTVQLRDVPRAAVESGCVVELREGCDKIFETCVTRFANAENFRGEPHLPGSDLLTRFPGA